VIFALLRQWNKCVDNVMVGVEFDLLWKNIDHMEIIGIPNKCDGICELAFSRSVQAEKGSSWPVHLSGGKELTAANVETFIDYHSRHSVDTRPASCDWDKAVCEPVRFANPRKNSAICILRSVHPRMHGLFALRLFLRGFPARSWDDLRFHNGEVHQTFHEAARQLGLVSNRDKKPKSVSKTPLISIDRQMISVFYWHRWSIMAPVANLRKLVSVIIW
jgi:hypothetical protein